VHEGAKLRKPIAMHDLRLSSFMADAEMTNEERSVWVSQALEKEGHVVVDEYLGLPLAKALHQQAQSLYAANQFRKALIGKNQSLTQNQAIRSDEICWLAGGVFGAPQSADSSVEHVPKVNSPLALFGQNIDALREALNRQMYLGLTGFECHLARYSEGAGYQAHLDVHHKSEARVLSFVYYLNPSWRKEHGGEVKFYEPDFEVEPILDRLVIFISAEKRHEVKQARRERFTLTGWMRRNA